MDNTSIKNRKLSLDLYSKEGVPPLEELNHLIKMNILNTNYFIVCIINTFFNILTFL